MKRISYVNIEIPEYQANLVKRILENHQSSNVRELSQIGEVIHEIDEAVGILWNEDYDQNAKCICDHIYERHFDGYDGMRAVGYKYCECHTFKEQS